MSTNPFIHPQVILSILSYLDPRQVIQSEQISKIWKHTIDIHDARLFRNHCRRSPNYSNQRWRYIYQEIYLLLNSLPKLLLKPYVGVSIRKMTRSSLDFTNVVMTLPYEANSSLKVGYQKVQDSLWISTDRTLIIVSPTDYQERLEKECSQLIQSHMSPYIVVRENEESLAIFKPNASDPYEPMYRTRVLTENGAVLGQYFIARKPFEGKSGFSEVFMILKIGEKKMTLQWSSQIRNRRIEMIRGGQGLMVYADYPVQWDPELCRFPTHNHQQKHKGQREIHIKSLEDGKDLTLIRDPLLKNAHRYQICDMMISPKEILLVQASGYIHAADCTLYVFSLSGERLADFPSYNSKLYMSPDSRFLSLKIMDSDMTVPDFYNHDKRAMRLSVMDLKKQRRADANLPHPWNRGRFPGVYLVTADPQKEDKISIDLFELQRE